MSTQVYLESCKSLQYFGETYEDRYNTAQGTYEEHESRIHELEQNQIDLQERLEVYRNSSSITTLGVSDVNLAFLEENERQKAVMQKLAKETYRMKLQIDKLNKAMKRMTPDIPVKHNLSKSVIIERD